METTKQADCITFSEAVAIMVAGELAEYALDVYKIEDDKLHRKLSHTEWEVVEVTEEMRTSHWYKHEVFRVSLVQQAKGYMADDRITSSPEFDERMAMTLDDLIPNLDTAGLIKLNKRLELIKKSI